MERPHTPINLFQHTCQTCGKNFQRQAALISHVYWAHTESGAKNREKPKNTASNTSKRLRGQEQVFENHDDAVGIVSQRSLSKEMSIHFLNYF
jgi:hypothetical protein